MPVEEARSSMASWTSPVRSPSAPTWSVIGPERVIGAAGAAAAGPRRTAAASAAAVRAAAVRLPMRVIADRTPVRSETKSV
ncbi:CRISPR-associated protein Cas5 [Glycomyces mayteni]|uniref:CRISPR-associated protein Cas5 n=1 Tax=Glycomyces mayteni TaxID=543887 RepID=A0ABW2D7C6_9ACTN